MSNYISKVPPVYKDWQFQRLDKGIDKQEFLKAIKEFENINPWKKNPEVYVLSSVQNSEFFLRLYHNSSKGNAVILSHFPDRYQGEFIKYIFELCKKLNANYYVLDNTGNPKEFDFKKFKKEIEKEYYNQNEEKVSEIPIDEHMELISIPTSNIYEVISKLKLEKIKETSWEEAVKECYRNSYMVRNIKDWSIVIGQTSNLVSKFNLDSNNLQDRKTNFLKLLKNLSQDFERIAYNFNSNKYGVFEEYKFEKGEIVYKYIHEDGKEVKEGNTEKEYFNDFKALNYDKSILKGVVIYE